MVKGKFWGLFLLFSVSSYGLQHQVRDPSFKRYIVAPSLFNWYGVKQYSYSFEPVQKDPLLYLYVSKKVSTAKLTSDDLYHLKYAIDLVRDEAAIEDHVRTYHGVITRIELDLQVVANNDMKVMSPDVGAPVRTFSETHYIERETSKIVMLTDDGIMKFPLSSIRGISVALKGCVSEMVKQTAFVRPN